MTNHAQNPKGHSRKQGPSVQPNQQDQLLQPSRPGEAGKTGQVPTHSQLEPRSQDEELPHRPTVP